MKKIRLIHDVIVPGWGVIPAGAAFRVARYNSRFVYVLLRDRVELRLARKGDCEKVY